MSLLVPNEFKRQINKYSGSLDHGTTFSHKNIRGLFRSPENTEYLTKQTYILLSSPRYINSKVANDSGDTLSTKFKTRATMILQVVPELVSEYKLPYSEDLVNDTPIQQLHFVNKKFLEDTSHNLILNPSILIENYYDINPDTGEDESNYEYQYTSSSYSDGTWHPEHLFTNSQRNRKNPYWVPLSIEFDNGPDARGPGNRYKHIADMKDERGIYEYDSHEYDIGVENFKEYATLGLLGSAGSLKNRRDRKFSRGGQFPMWQVTPHFRHYERDTAEDLREGGKSDRRVQRSYGYDMSTLRNRSSARSGKK